MCEQARQAHAYLVRHVRADQGHEVGVVGKLVGFGAGIRHPTGLVDLLGNLGARGRRRWSTKEGHTLRPGTTHVHALLCADPKLLGRQLLQFHGRQRQGLPIETNRRRERDKS